MPPLPPVAKTIRFQFFHSWSADLDVLTHLYQSAVGAATANDVALAAEAAENAWETNVLPLLVNTVTLTKVVATALDSNTAPQATVLSGVTGAQAVPATAAGTASVVSLKVARRFRGGHARMYLAGFPAADLATPQTWTAAHVTNVQNAIAAVFSAIQVPAYTGWTGPVGSTVRYFQGSQVVTNPITHRARNVPQPIPGGPVTETLMAIVASNKVGSQRRRNLQSA